MIKLRDYQEEAIDSLFDYFSEESGNPLIVAPTGSGKSIMIAEFVSRVYRAYPDQRVLILQQRKELIAQNFEKLQKLCDPSVHLGLYSAGLGVKQIRAKCLVAGIQSIFRNSEKLRKIDLVLIDEAHLLPPEGMGMYQTLLKDLLRRNPYLKVIGFTATPFRLKSGSLLDDDGLFTDIAYNTDMNRLIHEGYLSPLITKSGVESPDLSQVRTRAGEFVLSDSEETYTKEVSNKVIDEFYKYGSDRKSVLVFCSGVNHAEFFTELLRKRGENAECITGESAALFREEHIEKFKHGRIRFLVNVDVLTTGFDAPNVDCILSLRPTQSAGLWVQICGRGMRIAEDKENCLILDYGGNVERHGPIDCIEVRKKIKREKGSNEYTEQSEVTKTEVKICPSCRNAVFVRAMKCKLCGYSWPLEVKHDTEASAGDVLSGGKAHVKIFDVQEMSFETGQRQGKPEYFRIKYRCGWKFYLNDILCFNHSGFAKKIAEKKWKRLARDKDAAPPSDVQEAMFYATTGDLHEVEQVKCEKKPGDEYWTIKAYKFKDSDPIIRTGEIYEERETESPF